VSCRLRNGVLLNQEIGLLRLGDCLEVVILMCMFIGNRDQALGVR
jgi:hypothetical protein